MLALFLCVTNVAVAQTVPSRAAAREFRYGVCVRQEAGPLFDRLLGPLAELGVDTVRRDFDWGDTQSAPDQWDWARNDAVVAPLRKRGIEVQGVVAYTARWASSGDRDSKNWLDWSRAAPDVDAYCNYAAALARHYRGQVSLWEIWNEPDIDFWRGTPAQFTALFNAASAAVHEANPDARVLNGGFAFNVRQPNPTLLQDFVRHADLTHWDVWAYHDYHTFPQMLSRAAENRAIHEAVGSRAPIWINEGGFHDLLPGGEAEQAKTLVKKISAAPFLGATAYFWYNLIDGGDDPADTEQHFGLMRHDLTPKPAFFAYQTLIRQLSTRRFAQRLTPPSDFPQLWGLIYRATVPTDDDVMVLWQQGKQGNVPVYLGSDGDGAVTAAYDIDGKAAPAAALGNGRIITLRDAPQFVHIRGGRPPRIRSVLRLPDKLPLVGDDGAPFALTLSNPLESDIQYKVRFKGTRPGITVEPASTVVDVPAGKSVTVQAKCRSAEADRSDADAVSIELQASGDSAISAMLPCESAVSIPRTERGTDGGLKMELRDRGAVVNLFEAEPSPLMHWQGPDDLSGTATWAATPDALLLKVRVTDDRHVQRMTDANLWKSDSLQFAVRVSDHDPAYLEFSLALDEAGTVRTWVDSVPPTGRLAVGALDDAVGRQVTRQGAETTYELSLPWSSLGLDAAPPTGFRASFLVNDDDGRGRKQWLQLSDGIGREKDASRFRLFLCK